MKFTPLIMFWTIFATGCSFIGSSTKISVPSDIKSQVYGHLNSIPDCWEKQKIAGIRKNRSSLTVKRHTATDGKTIPIFVHNGVRMGGYQLGSCGGDSTIVIAAFADGRIDDRVLRHEICHHLDTQGPCLGGHHHSLAKGGCCPFWPYINVSSFEAPVEGGDMSVEVLSDGDSQMVCLERKTGDIIECAMIFPDVKVSAVEAYDEYGDAGFWTGLRAMSATLPAQSVTNVSR